MWWENNASMKLLVSSLIRLISLTCLKLKGKVVNKDLAMTMNMNWLGNRQIEISVLN